MFIKAQIKVQMKCDEYKKATASKFSFMKCIIVGINTIHK